MRPVRNSSSLRAFVHVLLLGVALVGALLTQVACGGGGGGGGSTGGGGKTLSSIAVSPAAPKLAAGTVLQLKATGSFSDGSTQDLTGSVTWSSSATAVDTVSTTGLCAALSAGTSTVKATSGAVSGSAAVTVTNATLTSITVTPANPVLAKGATQAFTATGHFSDGSSQDISLQATWSSSATAIATISPAGVATGVSAGSSTISAGFLGITGSTGLLVSPGAGVTVTALAVTPANPRIAAGTTLQLKATATFSDASTADATLGVAWGSSSAAVATVNATGLASGVSAGTSTVSATSGAVSGSTLLTVSGATLTAIAVSPVDPVIPVGATQAFKATGSFSDGSTQDLSTQVAWSSSSAATATINASGLASGLAAGSTTIKAAKGAVSGSTGLTVTGKAGVTLTGITVTPANPTIAAGTGLQFKATGTFSDASTLDLTGAVAWSSSAASVATVNASGFASGLAAGSATITATAGTVSGSTGLTVSSATLSSITVAPPDPVIPVGATQSFSATGAFSDGSTQDLTTQVAWTSSSPATATITATGVATGVAAGSATISAAMAGKTGSTGLLVTGTPGVTLRSIAVSPASATIAATTSVQFKATGTFSDGSKLDLTAAVSWTSSNAAAASVNGTGLATGLAAGLSTISATAGTVTGSASLTVTSATLLSIAVTPANAKLAAGFLRPYTATGSFSDGSFQDLTTQVAWSSSNPAAATISAFGVATGVAPGTTTLSATFGAVVGSTTLTVTRATLVTLGVTPANATVIQGSTRQYAATGTFSDGSTLDMTGQVSWSSSSPSVASIDGAGLAKGLSPGVTTLKAVSGSVTGSTALTVVPSGATLTSVTVSPTSSSIASGTTQAFTATGHYSDGTSLNLTSAATWTTSDPLVASISATGLAKGLSPGTVTIAATFGAFGGNASLTVTPAVLKTLALTPLNPTIAAGTSQKFTATGTFSDGTKQDLSASTTWSSSNTAAATVDASGNASGLAAGSSTITATSSGISASTSLTVTAATLVSISVTPANSKLASGYSRNYTATGVFSDGSTQNLTAQVAWSSSNTSVATINASGMAVGVNPGTATITATKGSVTASTGITVTNAVLVSIALSPLNSTVAVGASRQYTATGTFSDASVLNITSQVTWSSSNPAVATIDGTGVAQGASTGTVTIKAVAPYNLLLSSSTYLTVTPSGATLVGLTLSPSSASIAQGTSQSFTALGTFSNGSSQSMTNAVTWGSSDTAVATIASTGVAKGVGVGSATISATSGTVSGTATLSVTAAVLKSMTISPLNPSVAAGTSQAFAATGTFSDGTRQDLTASVAWSSSNPAVGTIDPLGLATSVAPGTTTIAATSGALSASTTLTVTSATLVSIAVTPANAKLAAGYTRAYTATGSFSDGSTQNLTSQVGWASSNTLAATIDASGTATGVAAGSTTISATFGTIGGSTSLTVTSATLVSIAVTPANTTVAAGGTRQFTATGTFSDASTLNLGTQASWTTANPAVASISASGLATGLAMGTTAVTATSGGVSGSTNLTVTPSGTTLSAISVSPSSAVLAKGQTQAFSATGVYANGTTQNLTLAVTWSSSDTTVATISTSGLAKAMGSGPTSITATLGPVFGAASLTVNPAALVSLSLSPLTPTAAAGTGVQFTATGTYTDGTKADLSASVSWSSSNPSAATVDTTGFASALAAGSTTIGAASGSVSASTTMTVTGATLLSIAVTPANAKVAAGTGRQFTATGSFSDGSTQNLTTQVAWTSSNTAAATISGTGFASGLSAGTTTIRAALGAVSGSTNLTVTSATLVSLAVTPVNSTLVKGATKQYAATGSFSDGSTQPMTSQVTWASSAPSVASVSSSGLATGLGVGTTTVSATFGSITGGTYLTVMPSGVTLASISVSPASASVPKGVTKAFSATAVYSDGSSQLFTYASAWTSSDTSVASVSTVGVAKGLAVGTSTIKATYGALSGAGSLTVTPAALSALAITPANPSIAAGTTQAFKATGTFTDGTKQDVTATVTWTSGTPSVATIDTAGLASGLSAGTSAISAASGSLTASTTLTVTSATLVSIAVSPATASIALNTGQQFKATGTFSDTTTQDLSTQVTWNSSNPAVATVDTKGFASGLVAGGATISATLGAVSGNASLTVTSATLVSLTLTPANTTVAVGGTRQFSATGLFSDATTQNLTTQVAWSSSNATLATISGSGLAAGLATGTVSIQATFGAVSSSTFLTVTPPSGVTLTAISVTPANPSVIAGATQQFAATGTYSDGSLLDLTHAVTWASSNGAVASIASSGLATSLAAGTSTIKATLGTVNGATTLTVVGVTLQTITVTPATPTIALTTRQQFTATGHYNDGSSADITASVTWSSSSTGVATIVPGGLATAVGAGTTTIQAASGAISGSTVLTVSSATLVSLAITPANPVIPKGTSQQFTAMGTFSDASTQDLTGQVGWTSSSTAVATISTTGLATGVAKGITTITASFGAVSGSTALTVSLTSAPMTGIVVTPAAPSIAISTTQQFTATAVFSDGNTQDITISSAWASSTPAVATVGSTGLATALSAGSSTITATANGLSGSAALTVTAATLSSIAVTPAAPSIAAGTGLQFKATGTFSNGSTQDITNLVAWSSSNGATATIASGGFASGLAAGSTTITATLGAVNGSTTLTVTSATLSSISLSPADPSIAKGTSQAFLAEGLFSDGSKQDLSAQVTWATLDPSVATIDTFGTATGAGVGTTTVTATFGAVSGSTSLTVTPATLVSISVAPPTASAPVGIGVAFTATGLFSDGSSQDLTAQAGWTSSNTAVAVVDPSGLASGLATGSASITATYGSIQGSATLTVTAATLVSITLDPPAPYLPLGSQQQMTATGLYSDGTTLDVTSQAVWTSSTGTVAQVDQTGLVTTPTGSVAGTTTVTATLSGVSGSTLVTVTAATLTSISVFGQTPLGVGTTDTYTATGIYSDGSSVDLTAQAVWSSSDTAVATVDNSPLISGTVTAVGAGTATITATFGGVSGSASVTVTAATLTSITVVPTSQTIAASTTLQYTATANFSDGSTQDFTAIATWASSNPAVASISNATGTEGLATGLSAGTTTISASFGGVVGSTGLTVTSATLVSLAVTPANSSLPRGFNQQMVATATFSDGSTQDVSTQAAWSSSNTTVAVISNALGTQGVVTALTAGTTTLTATLNGVSGSTGLTVTNVVLVSITVTPANKTLNVGRAQKYTATGTFSDGSTKKITTQVTWTSSDPTIARINAGKKGGAGKAYALSPGTVTITATKPPAGGQPAISGSTALTVK